MKKTDIEDKRISTPQKLLILFVVILAIFAIINAAWYFGYKVAFNDLASKMDTEETVIGQESKISYYKIVENQKCILGMPSYLGTGGQLCVSCKDGYIPQYDANGNIIDDNGVLISLYIWPQFFGGYELGIDFYSELEGIWTQVYIDADLNLTETENLDTLVISESEKLIAEYADEIQNLIDVAKEVWGIDFE